MPRSGPQRSLDVLFQRLLALLCWGVAGFTAFLLLGRLVQAWQVGIQAALLVTPSCSLLILVGGALSLRGRRPRQRTTDVVAAVVMGLMAINLAIGSIWVKDPIRLFNFAPLLIISGIFQRSRFLFSLSFLVILGFLALAYAQSPLTGTSVGLGLAVLLTCGAVGIMIHVLINAMLRRVENLLSRLLNAKVEIARLEELVPICSHCKKVRNDDGYWEQVETYIGGRTQATFSHGICPECVAIHWPEVASRRAASNNAVSDARELRQPPPTPA